MKANLKFILAVQKGSLCYKKKKRSESTNTFESLAFNIVNIYYINIIKRSGDW